MYPVTTEFQNKIKENTRTFKLLVQIQHSTGTLELTDKDIVGGSIVFNESSQTGDDFSIGGTVASTFEIEIFRKSEHNLIEFEGATIIPQVGLLISSSVDIENYFIIAPQPSEFEDSQILDQWEFVPLGRFNVDETNKSRNSIKLKAIDNMIELDKPYSLSNLSYPANLYQIYQNICTVADVQPATTSFTNQNYIVQTRPDGDYSLRDILGFVAELSGSFARCNRNGALELAWYEDVGLTLTGAYRFDFKPREDLIQIKGIKFETEDTVYIAGTDEYVADLTENPLLQSDYATVLTNIYNKVKDTVFTPFESRWQGNPALQTGDIITQVDRDNVSHTTIVTHSTYKYRGASTLAARGLPLKAKGYKGSTNKKISNIVRKEIKPIGDKLTSLEQAQLNVTELIANMLGGHVIKDEGVIYIADNPNINLAQKVWKWGIGGFGYSQNGINGPYTTGITADGTIVAMLVAANIITADYVKTGILSSEDDSTWINLNDGTFNFKNLISYMNGVLSINDPNMVKTNTNYNGVTITPNNGLYVGFTDGGHAQIGDDSILVQHIDGSHTKIDGRGITRIFSVPIFTQLPSGTNIIDNFETGNLANTRVDLANSSMYGFKANTATYPSDYIKITTEDKSSGTYGLKLMTPQIAMITDYPTRVAYISCRFMNYRPTKDTTFSLKYRLPYSRTGLTATLYVDDLDYPEIPTQIISLTSSNWSTAYASLTKHHTYAISVSLRYSGTSDNGSDYMYVDDITYELNVNESIITGYTQSEKPYYDFTYTRKESFPSGVTQKQITLPDYFKDMNFDVIIYPGANWNWKATYPATVVLNSINNMVPSFTVTCSRYPDVDVDFSYTVILNN